jgi:DNA polymerase elongation subunit (family B)
MLNTKGREDDEELEEDDGYEGAIVFPPIPGVYYRPITVLDFASLYPNAMRFRNLSHECFVDDPAYDNLPGYKYHNITYKNNNGTFTTCRFAEKRDGTKGIIPEILTDLLNARKKYKKMMESELDYFKKSVLDGLQQAYKVTANSLYGQTGASTSDVRMKEIAASTTATGREMLQFSKHFIENMYSTMLNLTNTDEKGYLKYIRELFTYFPTEFDIKDNENNDIKIHVNTEDNDKIPDGKFMRKEIGYDVESFFSGDILNICKWEEIFDILYMQDLEERINFKNMINSYLNNVNDDRIIACHDMFMMYENIWQKIKINTTEELEKKILEKIIKLPENSKKIFFHNLDVFLILDWSILIEKLFDISPKERTKFRDELENNADVTNMFNSYENMWKEFGINNNKELKNKVLEPISNLSEESRKLFFKNLHIAVNDLGFKNREHMFEKFYETMSEMLKGYTIDAKVIYGDSVTGDTPLLLRDSNNNIVIDTINNLGKKWEDYIYGSDKMQDTNVNYDVWTEEGWTKIKRVIKHKTNKKIYEVLTDTGCVRVTEDHSLLDENGNSIKPKDCNIGTELLHSFPKDKILRENNREDNELHIFLTPYQLDAMQYYYDAKNDGYFVEIDTVNKKDGIYYELRYYKKHDDEKYEDKNNSKIRKITEIKYEGEIWVYDLETENHHFHAGVGEMIVHNTDSVFFSSNIKDIKTGEYLTNELSLCMSIKLGIWASILICTLLPSPMAQEYEKVLWPFVIQGKKRYVGNLYEKNPKKFKQKSMGIELKRRDNAPIVKTVSAGIINKIVNERNPEGAFEFMKDILEKIIHGQFKMDKFVITKTIRGNAMTKEERIIDAKKPKEQRPYVNRLSIVHAVLADRIADRDPGNKPLSNDRIPYAYIELNYEPALQGERVETPEYIIENGLKLDYLFYITNQIMKPALKFLDLITTNASDLFKSYIMREENRRRCQMPLSFYGEKKIDELFDEDIDILEFDKKDKKVKKVQKKTKKEVKKLEISEEVWFDDF